MPNIHRYSAEGPGSVNTYAIEAQNGLILIDAQRSLSEARRALASLEPVSKPILAIFLTHPHPDHFGGLGIFAAAAPNAPIYASAATLDNYSNDRQGFVAKSREALGPDFPTEITLPTHSLQDTQTLLIDGLEIHAREVGAGEAASMTVLHLPASDSLFTADLIQHNMTPFLLEGRSLQWLHQLTLLRQCFPQITMAYPGHGQPAPLATLIEFQTTYLEYFRELVATNPDPAKVTAAMEQKYPGYLPVAAIPDLLTMNIDPVASELTKERQ